MAAAVCCTAACTCADAQRRRAPAAAAVAPCSAQQQFRLRHHQQPLQQQRRSWALQATPAGRNSPVTRAMAQGSGSGSGLSAAEEDRLCEEMAAFLREDLQHLFDDQGIDASKYDEAVDFEDPITRYTSIQGYIFNIQFLRKVFAPTFVLHDVKRTAPLELTTRWTMAMSLGGGGSEGSGSGTSDGGGLRRWFDPRLVFTGTSVMGINPQTGRFNRHVDTWDAVEQQGFFSLEAFIHMLSQVLDLRKRPSASATASFQVLKKRRDYEVRQYTAPPAGAVPQGIGGGTNVTPASATTSACSGVYAVAAFGGDASEAASAAAAQALRRALAADGLQPPSSASWLLVACDAGSPLLRRNEVLVPLQDFQLW